MKVLLILGNGFDLNLGLPTAYNHFYEYYLKNQPVNTLRGKIVRNSLYEWKNNIGTEREDIINWSDLELGLGKLSQKYKTPNEYLQDFDDVSIELSNYLKAVEKLKINSLDKVARQFIDDILKVSMLTDLSAFLSDSSIKSQTQNFKSYLDNNPTNRLSDFLSDVRINKSSLHLDVMTFNYTNTIERIFNKLEQLDLLSSKISLGEIYHIHQDLGEEGVVLGVNSINQIQNSAFHSTFAIYNGLVKPNLLTAYAAGVDKKCNYAMTAADVIIMFGVSMGVTDGIWWSKLGKLVDNGYKRIIYCPYECKEKFVYTSRAVVIHIHEIINSFLNKMNLSESEYKNVYTKVYPVRKNQMFNFGIYDDINLVQEENLNTIIKSLI